MTQAKLDEMRKIINKIRSQVGPAPNPVPTGFLVIVKNNQLVLCDPTKLPDVLDQQTHACAKCGDTNAIHQHHIIPRVEAGKDNSDNLIDLCWSCHMQGWHWDKENTTSFSHWLQE